MDVLGQIQYMSRRELLRFETFHQDLGWRIARSAFTCPRCGHVMTVRYNMKLQKIEIRCFHPTKHKGCGIRDIFDYRDFTLKKPEPIDVYCKFLDRFRAA